MQCERRRQGLGRRAGGGLLLARAVRWTKKLPCFACVLLQSSRLAFSFNLIYQVIRKGSRLSPALSPQRPASFRLARKNPEVMKVIVENIFDFFENVAVENSNRILLFSLLTKIVCVGTISCRPDIFIPVVSY